MKKWLSYLEEFRVEMDWKDIALFKCAICALGVMFGLSIPRSKKKGYMIAAGVIFASAYAALMIRLFGEHCPLCDIFRKDEEEEYEDWDDTDEDGFVLKIHSED